MSRPQTSGIPYFPLVTDWDQKLKLVRAKYKLLGVGCIVELWKAIYREGFALAWDEDAELLFADENSIDLDTLRDVVSFAADKGVFDKALLEERRVLSSHGIQKQWLAVVRKSHRTTTDIPSDLCLLSDSELQFNKVNREPRDGVLKYRENPANGAESSEETPQSKVKESKVKKRKEEEKSARGAESSLSEPEIKNQPEDEPETHPPLPPLRAGEDGSARYTRARKAWNEAGQTEARKELHEVAYEEREYALATLRVYTATEITEAIGNYAKIRDSPQHEITAPYRSFAGFIRGGVEKFVTSADPWSAYRKPGEAGKAPQIVAGRPDAKTPGEMSEYFDALEARAPPTPFELEELNEIKSRAAQTPLGRAVLAIVGG